MLDDSYPEVLMRQAGSPFEFLVSQTPSHPYGNAIMACELGVVVFEERPPTVGEAVRRARWRTMYQDDEMRQLMDAMAVLYMTAQEMQDVKDSHLYTYNLLGDPALAMRYPPVPLTIEADEEAVMGGEASFHGTAKGIATGTARVTLEVVVTSVPWDLEPVANPSDPPVLARRPGQPLQGREQGPRAG